MVNLKAFYYVPWEEFSVFGVPLFIHCSKDVSKLLRKVNWAKLCSWRRICLLTFSWTPHLTELIFNMISEWITILHMRFSKIPCWPIKTLCCLKTFIYMLSVLGDLYIIRTRKHDVYQIRTKANLEIFLKTWIWYLEYLWLLVCFVMWGRFKKCKTGHLKKKFLQ